MSVVKINAISVPADNHEELEKRFAHRAHSVDGSPGFLGFQDHGQDCWYKNIKLKPILH